MSFSLPASLRDAGIFVQVRMLLEQGRLFAKLSNAPAFQLSHRPIAWNSVGFHLRVEDVILCVLPIEQGAVDDGNRVGALGTNGSIETIPEGGSMDVDRFGSAIAGVIWQLDLGHHRASRIDVGRIADV